MADDTKPGRPADAKPVESASAAPGEKRSAARPHKDAAAGRSLAKASESGDPAVHQALASLNAAQMNKAASQASTGKAEQDAQGHDDAIKAARKALADLGYE